MSSHEKLQVAFNHHRAGHFEQAETIYLEILKVEPGNSDALNLYGMLAHHKGHHETAIEFTVKAIQSNPTQPAFYNSLGTIYQETGAWAEAVACYQMMLSLHPDSVEGNYNLANSLSSQGKLEEAVSFFRKALTLKPDFVEALNNMGDILRDQGKLDEAAACFQKALVLNPDFVLAHNNLGNVLMDQGKLDEAAACFQKALALNPDFAVAHNNLGKVTRAQGKLDDAVACFRKALGIKQDYTESYCNLASVLQEQGGLDEAVTCYRKTLTLDPNCHEALYNLGNVLIEQKKFDEAIAYFQKSIALKPDFADAYNNLGTVFKDSGKTDEAIASYQQAIALDRSHTGAYNNLGSAVKDLGELQEAVGWFRKALALNPEFTEAHSNLIFTLDMSVETNTESLQQERTQWAQKHAAHLPQYPSHPNLPDPERRLRIGYVSADFRNHSAHRVFGAMLTRFDRSRFDVYAYSNTRNEDEVTQLFQNNVTCWRKILGLPDQAVAEMIYRDNIDILVDLSGHSAGNRLLVFARKPAPVQITAWGYIGGTGMQAMDVFFADPVIVPPEEKPLYAEEIRYLPNVVNSFSSEAFPAINGLPALAGGGITFGSFNRRVKITENTFKIWTQILSSVPNSRMVFKTLELNDAGTRNSVLTHFIREGIAPERITLLGGTSWQDHMAAFNRIDISLDPFPHGGGVTALEGLRMGVPVVTLRWPTIPGRLSASILTTLGLTDWIAETPEQYIDIAVQKAQNLTALAELRHQLRPRFTASIIGNPDAYVSAVEQEYRSLWQDWCHD